MLVQYHIQNKIVTINLLFQYLSKEIVFLTLHSFKLHYFGTIYYAGNILKFSPNLDLGTFGDTLLPNSDIGAVRELVPVCNML